MDLEPKNALYAELSENYVDYAIKLLYYKVVAITYYR